MSNKSDLGTRELHETVRGGEHVLILIRRFRAEEISARGKQLMRKAN